ncbi:MAG: hypothetical protein PHW52_00545 [Candidatus Pacebacteria bacterium]|nr:hypothetical protein [Candidatus Paceibacterota bacterium]
MFPFDLLPLKLNFQLDELMMLMVALMLDVASLILLFLALDDFGLLDTCGIVIIGAWTFVKSGSMPSRKGGKNPGSKLMGRFMGVGAVELIPYVGVLPTWTLYVYSVAKDGSDEVDAIKREGQMLSKIIGR